MASKRTTIYLEDKDRRASQTLQIRYGLATLSDAIRFSLRVCESLSREQAEAVGRSRTQGQTERIRQIADLIKKAKGISRESQGTQQKIAEFLKEVRTKP